MKFTSAFFLILVFSATQLSATPCRAAPTVLALKPEYMVLPFEELSEGNLCFEIELQISNVPRLKEFHLNFSYDSTIVELIEGELDNGFLSKSEGGTGNEFNMLLTSPYTGSGILGRYTFRIINPGNTTIKLNFPHLLDQTGNPIIVSTQDCNVRVLKLGDYSYFVHIVEGQLRDLQNEYSILESQYLAKTQAYETLSLEYNDLNDIYNELDTSYRDLESEHQSLSESYDELRTENATLKRELENTRQLFLIAIAVIIIGIIVFYQVNYRK